MILNSYNNILVLAPHTDDGELGLGGTISKLIELGKKVTYVAFRPPSSPYLKVFRKIF